MIMVLYSAEYQLILGLDSAHPYLSVSSFRLKFIPFGIKKQQSDKKVSALTKTTVVSKIR